MYCHSFYIPPYPLTHYAQDESNTQECGELPEEDQQVHDSTEIPREDEQVHNSDLFLPECTDDLQAECPSLVNDCSDDRAERIDVHSTTEPVKV